ncbi:MAG TPA: valine--tRNA ligase [Kiritimatiellia bacterium]|nr:valine--tRNA ligase [Kiritimatiellia bacterium]HMO98575.1 valine--tRNA ligase [Kiritimatiellia bacterium]HMP95446.1 valine--tRNA ligase [Kiritimatiellia bacterium]
MSELPKNYNSREIEEKWSAFWIEHRIASRKPEQGGEPYCIVIPPPNVTGILHMGHALNNTIQDILTRWRSLQGRNSLWVPGTDHAGIATQNVVERALKKQENKGRRDLGRDEFVKRVWQWKDEYGGTIIRQLKRLGCACDWDRERFTMDEGLSNAVKEVFVRLYDKGLIYRGKYIINWCPRCETALSDEESEHQSVQGKLYHFRYPVKDEPGRYVTVATTRPETYLGDTAVAVNPKDERYADLVGKTLILPVLNREIPVIADDFVDPAFGTGCVKVTPAHDPNDFAMGQRHHLPMINVMTDDGHMNEEAGPYQGLERFACRKKIMDDMAEAGLLDKVDEHPHAVGHCYRCHQVVEPRLSPQWFVKMKPLAEPALAAVKDGRITFVPDRWNKVYIEWMENIRDWCISRQIWWGHRIPVFYCDDCGHEWAERGQPTVCPKCGSSKIRQDEDVLDTWFSSWLWPFSVFGWPETNKDLAFYYPTHSLATASEIIFFWVARMIMAGFEFMGDIPFREVYIHGTVRDDIGRKMSKSLGNSIDPLDIINEYSADALRFSLIMLTATGQDVYVSKEKFEIGRNFGTKIWNAARFMQMHLDKEGITASSLALNPDTWRPDDWHIIARIQDAAKAAEDNLTRYRFNDYAKVLYEFLWHEFCDWYLEYAKEALYGEDRERKHEVLRIMLHVFSRALRLLHPLMPFLTEELWHAFGFGSDGESILQADWPLDNESPLRNLAEPFVVYVDGKHELIRAGRTLRADHEIGPSQKMDFVIKPAATEDVPLFQNDLAGMAALLKAGVITVDPDFQPSGPMPNGMTPRGVIFMSMAGIDVEAEKKRLGAEIQQAEQSLAKTRGMLGNEKFMAKAKPEVVDQTRANEAALVEKIEKLRRMLAGI